MTTSTTPQLSPAQDHSLMMRQALIRQAQDRITALSLRIAGERLPDGWAGRAADEFLVTLKQHLGDLERPLLALEEADRIITGWRNP